MQMRLVGSKKGIGKEISRADNVERYVMVSPKVPVQCNKVIMTFFSWMANELKSNSYELLKFLGILKNPGP